MRPRRRPPVDHVQQLFAGVAELHGTRLARLAGRHVVEDGLHAAAVGPAALPIPAASLALVGVVKEVEVFLLHEFGGCRRVTRWSH